MTLNVYTVTADGMRVYRPVPADSGPADDGQGGLSPMSLMSGFPPCACPRCKPARQAVAHQAWDDRRALNRAS